MKPNPWRFFSRLLAGLGLGLSLPFSTLAVPITITNAVVGGGLMLGVGTFESGSQATFRAVPQVDWQFDHWEGVPQASATQNPIALTIAPGLQPIAVMASAPGHGRVTSPLGATDLSGWARLSQEYGIAVTQTNLYPQSVSILFKAPEVKPGSDPGITKVVTIDESGRVSRDTNALPFRGCQVAGLQIFSILTTGSWLVLSPSGSLVDVSYDSFSEHANPNSTWVAMGVRREPTRFTAVNHQGQVDTGLSDGAWPSVTNTLTTASGIAQIAFDPVDLNVEEGDPLLLAARVVPFDSLQWCRNGVPQPGLTQLCLNQPIDSSATYQLLAKRGDQQLLTTPTRVRVLPKGYPRVYVNSIEVPKSHRDGNPVSLALKSSFQGGQVFYTLDGSAPSINSPRYTNSFTITNAVIVRALAFSEDFSQSHASDPVTVTVRIDTKYFLRTDWVGLGTVTANPPGGLHIEGDIVQLTANPGPGYVFTRWEGDISGTNPVTQVAMLGNRLVKAVFDPLPRFQVIVTTTAGTTTGSGWYPIGSEVRIGVSPNAGWQFTGWTGSHQGTETNFPWIVADTAHFVAHLATPITRSATGPGRIQLIPDLPLYPFGTQVLVTPIAEPGAYQALWGGIGTGLPRGAWSFTVTNPTPRITALFQPLGGELVGLSLSVGSGGSVTQPNPEGIYPNGTRVDLIATPDDGYEFAGWSGDMISPNPKTTVVMDQNKTVVATFQRRPILTLTQLPNDSRLRLEFIAPANLEVIVETSADLAQWDEQFRLTGQGESTPVRITLSPERDIRSRFWRLRKP